jgi:triosephosphate isomerase (TIM)
MRKPIVAGNWKMNGSKASIAQLLEAIKSEGQKLYNTVELIVFPPSVYLEQVKNALQGSPISWGAQNISAKQNGAFTGEVAAPMLNDFGCQYVLIGHSERRTLYGESDKDVAAKYRVALQAGLKPIICVGETLQERNAGVTHQIIDHQLHGILASAEKEGLRNTVIAYEPVWAIGTGLAAKPEDVQEVHALIREIVAKHDKDIAEQLRILYGGSVKRDNAAALFAMPDIDGGLIGGASLDAKEFLDIAKSCNN